MKLLIIPLKLYKPGDIIIFQKGLIEGKVFDVGLRCSKTLSLEVAVSIRILDSVCLKYSALWLSKELSRGLALTTSPHSYCLCLLLQHKSVGQLEKMFSV